VKKKLIHITEDNKHLYSKPNNSDLVFFSNVCESYGTNPFRCFGIKYPFEIQTSYLIAGKRIEPKQNEYYIAAENKHAESYFRHKNPRKGICIDISPGTLSEVYTIVKSSEDYDLENYLANRFEFPNFPDHLCHVQSSRCGILLENLMLHLLNDSDLGDISSEWFYDFVEQLILQEMNVAYAMNDLNSIRLITRKEIVHRLFTGKSYMDDCFLLNPSISEVARVSNLSYFHFHRCFRQFFNQTPNQYLQNKRMEYAWKVLNNQKEFNVSQVAIQCSFSDLQTFSKAFTKKYKISPSKFRRSSL